MTSILNRQVNATDLVQSGDFLGFSLSFPEHHPAFDYVTEQGVRVEMWDSGIACLTPAQLTTQDIVLSCGIHGNETAPIELVAKLVQDILTGVLPLTCRLLVLIGNPPAINAAKRELVDNLNRLFSGHHSKGEFIPSWERSRAALLEQAVLRFYQSVEPSRHRALYDLHTAIRGSVHEKFAVYPYLHGEPWSETQLRFLAACGVNTFLLMQTPASTFSYFAAQTAKAHGFTLELGKVRPFGQNDMSRFTQCDIMLRRLVSGENLNLPAFSDIEFNFFVVSRSINKQTEQFKLCFANDIENFTQFPLGTVLAEDGDTQITVDEAGEAIIFPNANVALGQRAMLLVKPTDIRGQTAP